jgi:hypothetical protein
MRAALFVSLPVRPWDCPGPGSQRGRARDSLVNVYHDYGTLRTTIMVLQAVAAVVPRQLGIDTKLDFM